MLFKTVQERTSMHPCQLLLDVKDRWSSTYVMLIRAESQRQVSFPLYLKSSLNYSPL